MQLKQICNSFSDRSAVDWPERAGACRTGRRAEIPFYGAVQKTTGLQKRGESCSTGIPAVPVHHPAPSLWLEEFPSCSTCPAKGSQTSWNRFSAGARCLLCPSCWSVPSISTLSLEMPVFQPILCLCHSPRLAVDSAACNYGLCGQQRFGDN